MSEKVKELTSDNFNDFIKKGNVVVDFWAEWCAPCQMMKPILEEIAAETENIKIAKVNVETESELAQRFQVMSIPTLIFFKNKEQVNRTVGAITKEEIQKLIEESF